MALSLTVLQPAWMAHARCREADPALFYPRFADQSFYAKWGGLTRIERRKLRRLADQKAARPAAH